MEVSMNGGISVVDPASAKYERHVSLGSGGIPDGLAVDEARHLLFVSDIANGQLCVFDAQKLVQSDAAARQALLARLPLPVDPQVPRIRPEADFGVNGRAGIELHSGPRSLALVGARLYILSRFSGAIVDVDVSQPSAPRVVGTLLSPSTPLMVSQRERRLGEVLYYTDLGRSAMSCDGCHMDGHAAGVLFEKTHPLRIYRVSTLRNIAKTPPYFFPGRLKDLDEVSKVVTGRNRFHNPDPTPTEIAALTIYQAAITALPNPYLLAGVPKEIVLPDGKRGDPLLGFGLFFGAAGCGTSTCHPAPEFTVDQDPKHRGENHDVGTPMTQPLRPELQEALRMPLGVPSLVGAWDTFPLLASGAGGLDVAEDGTLEPRHPFALRRVLEFPGSAPHGNVAALSEKDRNDLLAYLLTL